MLYSIIPPILIIISLIGIILLLMKKSSEVSRLPKDVLAEYEKNDQQEDAVKQKNGFLGKFKWAGIKNFLLLVLEKIVRKFRMFFLKLESKFDAWSKNIRNRKEGRKQEAEKAFVPEKDGDIMEKLSKYEFKNYDEPTFVRNKQSSEEVSQNEVATQENAIEENESLVVSRNVSRAKKPKEMKDRLEELLIERIAINPKDTEAYERLGEYYMEIQSWTDAKECFKQVIKLDPKNRNVRYKIRRLESVLTAKK